MHHHRFTVKAQNEIYLWVQTQKLSLSLNDSNEWNSTEIQIQTHTQIQEKLNLMSIRFIPVKLASNALSNTKDYYKLFNFNLISNFCSWSSNLNISLYSLSKSLKSPWIWIRICALTVSYRKFSIYFKNKKLFFDNKRIDIGGK